MEIKIKFRYGYNEYIIKFEQKDLLKNVLNKYSAILDEDINNLIFIFKGKILSTNNQCKLNKLNNRIIFVFKKNNKINKNIKYILCPDCKNLSFLNIIDNNFIIENCNNNHKNIYSSINEFIENQIIDEIGYKCEECGNNKKLYNNNNFYICSCGKNICKLCINKHKEHN